MRRLFCSRERGGEMLLYVTEKEIRNSLSFLTFIERLVIYFCFQYNRHEVFGSISLERHTCLSASSFTHRSFRSRRRTTFTPLNASLPYTSPPLPSWIFYPGLWRGLVAFLYSAIASSSSSASSPSHQIIGPMPASSILPISEYGLFFVLPLPTGMERLLDGSSFSLGPTGL